MTKFVSRRGKLGLAKETSRGTGVAPSIWVPWSTMSFLDKTEVAREEQGQGVRADSDSVYTTLKWGEGEVEAELYDKALGLILMSILGAAPVTSGGGPYTHTYTLSDSNQPQSLSLYWTDPIYSLLFRNAVVDELEITVEPKGMVEYKVAFMSKSAQDYAQQSSNYTSLGNKFLHQHVSIKLANTVAGLGAATAISVKKLTLTLKNNAKLDEVVGTAEPEDILGQQFSVEGELELNREDDTYRGYMLNNTYKAMDISFTRSSSSSLQFQMPRVDFTEWEWDNELNEISIQTVQFKGNYDQANALAAISTAILINSQTSY